MVLFHLRPNKIGFTNKLKMSEFNKFNFKLVQKIQNISNSTFQPLSFMNNFVSGWIVFTG